MRTATERSGGGGAVGGGRGVAVARASNTVSSYDAAAAAAGGAAVESREESRHSLGRLNHQPAAAGQHRVQENGGGAASVSRATGAAVKGAGGGGGGAASAAGSHKRPPPPAAPDAPHTCAYADDRVDPNEQVSLLNRLANAEGTSQVKQDKVMAVMPDWQTLEGAGLIPPGLSRVLSKLSSMDLDDFSEMLSADPDLVVCLFGLLRLESDLNTVQYVLTLFCEVVRDDSSKYEALCAALQHTDVFHTFQRLLEAPNLGSYIVDRAALLLSGLMCRARTGTFGDDQVEYLIQGLMLLHTRSTRSGTSSSNGKFLLSEAGRLDAAANLLKIDRYRPMVWQCRGFSHLILRHLALSQPAGMLYRAVFCTWLLTFHAAFLEELQEQGHVLAICKILKESRVEKVIRVALYVLNNLLKCDAAVETIVEQNVAQAHPTSQKHLYVKGGTYFKTARYSPSHTTAQVLALLEFEKWRDADLYDEIRAEISHLDVKIRQFNNFDRYCNELQKGVLTWSVLHSEKFWRENVMAFEKDEFRAIKQLVHLLDSDNKATLAIACYDLGEFAHLHPAGKKICQKLKVKDRVMLLISDRDREVAGEALLCIQKLMLDRWEDVAELQKK